MIKPTVRLNLDIDRSIYRELKADCALRGVTITDLVTRLIVRELKRRAKKGTR